MKKESRHPSAEEISEYLDSDLKVIQRSRIEAHISECPTCRARLDQLRHMVASFDRLVPDPEMAPHLRQLQRNLAKRTVVSPPGWRLRKLAEFVASPKVYQQILEPTLQDLCDEYNEAWNAGRPHKATWVRIRGYWSFWSAFLAQLPISVFKAVYGIWKAIP